MTRDLEESLQEVENLRKKAAELRNSADQAKCEASKSKAAVDQQKNETELVMKMELAREEEVKVVVGQLELRLSELSTRLEGEVQDKIILEGIKLEMQDKLDKSSEAFEKILEQLEAKTDLVGAQKISIDNLYSQLTVSNQSFEALSKAKDGMEAMHVENIAELANEHKEKIGEMEEDHKETIAELMEEHKEKIAELSVEHKDRVREMEKEHKEEIALMAEEHKVKFAKMVKEHERLETDLADECKEKMAEEKCEHEMVVRTMEEEHKKAKREIEADCKKVVAQEKAECEQVMVEMEKRHQKAMSDMEEQHGQAIQVLEVRAEEWKIQVGSLTEQILVEKVQSDELKKKLAENHEELDRMNTLVMEKNGEVEKNMKRLKEKEEHLAVIQRRQEVTLEELNLQFKLKEEYSQAQIKEKETRICELQDRMEEMKSKHIGEREDAGKKEAGLKIMLDTCKQQIKELEQSLGDSNHTYAANISGLEAELTAFKLKIVKLETSKNEATKKLDQLEKDLVDVKLNSTVSVKALEKKLGDAHSLVGQLQDANSGLETVGERNAVKIADLDNLLMEKENVVERFKEEQDSSARCMKNHVETIRKLEGKLSDAVTKTNLYKSKIEATSQEFLATIEDMEASKAEASATIREYQKRLEELAQQEDRREKALVVGTAAALAVGLLAFIVK